jgi:hypothetical protein
MARKRNELRSKGTPERKTQIKRRVGHDELIAQLTPENRDPGNECSVTDALIEERRSGPADLDDVFDQYEIEREAFRCALDLRRGGEMPRPEHTIEGRRVAGPLNNPIIEAYKHLYARLSEQLNSAEDLHEKMALCVAASPRQCDRNRATRSRSV